MIVKLLDIKRQSNVVLSGHLKLTDFGLSSTGMRDKELHVADLVAKTPFPAGSKVEFILPFTIIHADFNSLCLFN